MLNICCGKDVPTGFCNTICISGLAFSEREYNKLGTKRVSDTYRNKLEVTGRGSYARASLMLNFVEGLL